MIAIMIASDPFGIRAIPIVAVIVVIRFRAIIISPVGVMVTARILPIVIITPASVSMIISIRIPIIHSRALIAITLIAITFVIAVLIVLSQFLIITILIISAAARIRRSVVVTCSFFISSVTFSIVTVHISVTAVIKFGNSGSS